MAQSKHRKALIIEGFSSRPGWHRKRLEELRDTLKMHNAPALSGVDQINFNEVKLYTFDQSTSTSDPETSNALKFRDRIELFLKLDEPAELGLIFFSGHLSHQQVVSSQQKKKHA